MTGEAIQARVNELRELRRMADELAAEIEAIQDSIKQHMTAEGADELMGADFKITWKFVSNNRLDVAALKKAVPEIASRFTTHSEVRRFVLI